MNETPKGKIEEAGPPLKIWKKLSFFPFFNHNFNNVIIKDNKYIIEFFNCLYSKACFVIKNCNINHFGLI